MSHASAARKARPRWNKIELGLVSIVVIVCMYYYLMFREYGAIRDALSTKSEEELALFRKATEDLGVALPSNNRFRSTINTEVKLPPSRSPTRLVVPESSTQSSTAPAASSPKKDLAATTPIGYVVLTTGAKYKYVWMIVKLLTAQGVHKSDIHLYLQGESTKLAALGVTVHDLPKATKTNPNVILTTNYVNMFASIFAIYEHVVIFEDDIFPGESAVAYFEWGAKLMKMDHTVLSVSGSNDNAHDDFHRGVLPDVVLRANQFLGLGWMTSRRMYTKFLKQYLDQCPQNKAWDQCVSAALKASKTVSVFPMVQRAVHVPYSKGTHMQLVGLNLLIDPNVTLPDPAKLTQKLYRQYAIDEISPRCDVVRVSSSFKTNPQEWHTALSRTGAIWPISHLAGVPFGYSQGVAVFPGEKKPMMILEPSRKSDVRFQQKMQNNL